MTGKSCQPSSETLRHQIATMTIDDQGHRNSELQQVLVAGYVALKWALPLQAADETITAIASRAEQDAKRIEDLEAALRCISTPADVSKMKARIEGLEAALREIDTLATCTGVVDPKQHQNMLSNIYRIGRAALQRGGA